MITIQDTKKIAEMAKIEISETELSNTCSELDKMAKFAHEVSEAAERINAHSFVPEQKERDDDRPCCEMDSDLSGCKMHIKDGFFRIEAGKKK